MRSASRSRAARSAWRASASPASCSRAASSRWDPRRSSREQVLGRRGTNTCRRRGAKRRGRGDSHGTVATPRRRTRQVAEPRSEDEADRPGSIGRRATWARVIERREDRVGLRSDTVTSARSATSHSPHVAAAGSAARRATSGSAKARRWARSRRSRSIAAVTELVSVATAARLVASSSASPGDASASVRRHDHGRLRR